MRYGDVGSDSRMLARHNHHHMCVSYSQWISVSVPALTLTVVVEDVGVMHPGLVSLCGVERQ